jgi:predicted amidohydrolase YtcJ
MSSADAAILGARIRTLDPECPSASAVAWSGGTVVAVGADDEVRAVCDSRTEVIDARRTAIVPGLVDGHFHPLTGVDWTAGGVDLASCQTLDDARARLAEQQARVSNGDWVVGYGLSYGVFPGGDVDGRLLADAVGGAPAFVFLYDGHGAVATPRALELAGVDGPRQLPGNSEVVCRAGAPTGALREMPAQELVRAAMPVTTAAQRRARYVAAAREWNALGLTGVHAMDGSAETFEILRELEAHGDLTLRTIVAVTVTPEMSPDERGGLLALRDERGSLWRCGAAKFFIDGTIDAGTAWLFEPDAKGESTKPYWPEPEEYVTAVAQFASEGFQCVTHAIGDRAVQAALDAYRAVRRADGVAPHRIEHIETLRDEELGRFAQQGVVASMQPVHADLSFDGDAPTWPKRLDPERVARGWRYGDLKRSGAIVALGSDWPLGHPDPRITMASARLRRPPWRPEAEPHRPDQALTPLQALEGLTLECARAAGEADRSGAIRPGCRADLTGFTEDPVACEASDLADLPVTLTVVDGRVVHRVE